MNSTADWMVVVGFVLTLTGITLRVVVMMRSSDLNPATSSPLVGRALVRAYRAAKPSSKLPWVMWLSISAGLVLLIAGMLLEFR
jgi:uncharacterized protein (DUF2252 family)